MSMYIYIHTCIHISMYSYVYVCIQRTACVSNERARLYFSPLVCVRTRVPGCGVGGWVGGWWVFMGG